MRPRRGFASDNNAGAHPAVLRAVAAANRGHVVGYGDDPYTERVFARLAKRRLRKLQGESFFYVWDEDLGIARWMCSFDTAPGDVRRFVAALHRA